jgi:hypothetical protein
VIKVVWDREGYGVKSQGRVAQIEVRHVEF